MMSGVSDAPTPAPAPPAGVRAWLRDLGAVVAQGVRLWVRSWPVLLVIALLAVAGRHAAGWAAVNASTVNNTFGWAALVLAPLSMVAGIVAMLHVLRRDLPALAAIGRTRAPDDPASGHERGLVDVLASVFVPFLALYASYGLLAEDRSRFLNTAAYREFRESFSLSGEGADGSFVDLATGWGLVAVVVVAVVLRWLLGRWEGRSHRRALAFAGAYVEAFWLLAVAAFATQMLDSVWTWIESRRAVAIVLEWWLTVLDALGPVAGPIDAAVNAVAGVLGNLDDLVVIPLAWLTVGAVVYGHKLATPPKHEPRLRPPAAWQRVPAPVRRWTTEAAAPVVGDVRGRFTALVDGLRRLAIAGLGPMLVFALAFLVATRIEEGILLLFRAISGPQDVDTWLAFAPMVSSVATAVGLTVTMALLAAGVDRILAGQAAVAAREPVPAVASEV